MNGSAQNRLSGQQRFFGIASSVYLALSYLVGIVIFLFVLRYPEIKSAAEKVRIVTEMKSMVFLTNILMYILFGPVLVLFILALQSAITNSGSILARLSAIIGYIWAGSLTASGMIANAAIDPVTRLSASNPDQAAFFWQILDTVSMGIGNGNGEILGGLMTLGFGIVMLKEKRYGRVIGVFGIIVGAIGMLSLIPALIDMPGVFGITQLIWFIIVGVSFMRAEKGTIR